MTDEEKAEEYIMREDVVTENDRVPVDNGYGWQTVSFEDEVKRAYLDGLEEGKPKWHDLRKNPDDLPNDCRYVWTNIGAGYHDDDGWWDAFGRLQDVTTWCEPKLEE